MLVVYQNEDHVIVSGEITRLEPKGQEMILEVSNQLQRPVTNKPTIGTIQTTVDQEYAKRASLRIGSKVILECDSIPEFDIIPYGGETKRTHFSLRATRVAYTGHFHYDRTPMHGEENVLAGTICDLSKWRSKNGLDCADVTLSVRVMDHNRSCNRQFHIMCFGETTVDVELGKRMAFITGGSETNTRTGKPTYKASNAINY
ncbi:MAG: hypothetical protein Q4B26_15570 [Eubacteriales bacterium]|nr:hypothetical protein [Eubacteriales bacterium]